MSTTFQIPNDLEKKALWDAYLAGKPTRVPVFLGYNPRIWLLDPALNKEGLSFADVHEDPEAHVRASLHFQLHCRTVLNHCTDGPTELPDQWEATYFVSNIYEAACFGAEIQYPPDQVPVTEPCFLSVEEALAADIPWDRPMELPYIKEGLRFWNEMEKVCRHMVFEGRPVTLQPWDLIYSDGPVTVSCNLVGTETFLLTLAEEPGLAGQLLERVVRAAIARRRAILGYWEGRVQDLGFFADDDVALLSIQRYVDQVLPWHRLYYDSLPEGRTRHMHLCGNAGRLFPTIVRELGVTALDTGFPLDFGRLRREIGPTVEVSGGPSVAILMEETPEQVFTATSSILQSGIMEGGRFKLREGNNLPPACPLENLRAMYEAALTHGQYP